MNVLFISFWYPTPRNPHFGVFIKEHAHAVHSVGNSVVLLAVVLEKSKDFLKISVTDKRDEVGMRTVILQVNSIFKDIIYYLIPLLYLLVRNVYNKHIKAEFNPDIIHSNVIFPAGIIGHFLASKLKKPHVITEHWSRISGFKNKPILFNLFAKSYRNADAILPVSVFLKEKILSIIPGLNNQQFNVVGNVVSSDVFYYKDKALDNSTINICAIATWNNKKIPDKLPHLFIESLALTQSKFKKEIKLTMIGGGNQVEELNSLCTQLNLDVVFTGFISKSKICDILHSSDFLVHASTIETFGVGVAEALMTGTPVICSNVGALPELVNKSNGVLCENNVDSWVAGLTKAISIKYNRKEIADNIKVQFNQQAIGKQISDVYSKLIPAK